eukprot:CAMPEP_0116140300 /NCGR_PEP_ID=MMETSP0329-20121206/13769_1 /TAXON_ID=697910 /ORGANISM="Pseudo-nitzschia arenysensis, Strain B593" /LENGTH=396 /DNA_ID=CAMNT_0003635395 /DNA_START=55 /DNA_END=1245 /DNA_ORIENTATION=-
MEFYYLTKDARENLKTYQYKGGDNSLLYRYILAPLATFLVNTIVPKSLAPNTITSIGLVWMITAYVAYWWYVPSLEVEDESDVFYPPRWIFLWNGIAILVYQTLDNMDGRQARRTGSSSPLGLLFDHGCDAINSIFGSANVIIGMNLSPSENLLETWLLVFGPFFLFYIATWEQYYTGELIMPIVNGPSEGLVGTAVLSFVSYVNGPEYWQGTDVFDSLLSISFAKDLMGDVQLRNCDLIVLAVSLGVLQEIFIKSVGVILNYKGSGAGLIPMFILAICYFVIGYMDPNVWLAVPRSALHLAMGLFVEASTELMLVHTTDQPFFPWRWQFAPLIGMTCWVAMFGNSEGLQYSIVAYASVTNAYLVMKFNTIIHEICEVLGIWCFDIVTPHHSVKKI